MTDYTVGDTIYFMFTTRQFSTGAPFTLAGSPVVSAYEDNSLTQITAGVSLGVDHDSVTGLNLVTVVASGANGFEAGKDYHLVVTTGTVDSVSVVGEVVGRFTLERSAAAVDLANGTDGLGAIKADTAAVLTDTADMQPKLGTVTDLGGGATLAANNADMAGATFSNSTDSLEAIRNKETDMETDTQDIQSRLPSALVGGRMDSNISAINGGATTGANATLTLKRLVVTNNDSNAAVAISNSSTGAGIQTSSTAGPASIYSGGTGRGGIETTGGTNASGFIANGNGTGHGIDANAGVSGVDISADITGDITGNLSGSIGSLGTTAKADVNAEVVDTLSTDTYAEPGQGTPGATISLAAKINFIYKWIRNRITQTSTTISIYSDDGTTVDHKATHSDNGTTYDRGEFTTGP